MPRRRRPHPIARHSLGLALAAPEVVAHRLARVWLAGATPSRRDRDEFMRMGTEKVAAFQASWLAVTASLWQAGLRLAWSPWWWASLAAPPSTAARRLTAQGQRIALDALGQGMAPWHRQAAANAVRLRRPSR